MDLSRKIGIAILNKDYSLIFSNDIWKEDLYYTCQRLVLQLPQQVLDEPITLYNNNISHSTPIELSSITQILQEPNVNITFECENVYYTMQSFDDKYIIIVVDELKLTSLIELVRKYFTEQLFYTTKKFNLQPLDIDIMVSFPPSEAQEKAIKESYPLRPANILKTLKDDIKYLHICDTETLTFQAKTNTVLLKCLFSHLRNIMESNVVHIVSPNQVQLNLRTDIIESSTENLLWRFIHFYLQLLDISFNPQGLLTFNQSVNIKADIIYVDDDPIQRKLVTKKLSQDGYDVTVAIDGPEILRIIKKNPSKYACALIDIQLPGGLNGFSVAKEIKRLNPEIKLIGVSGLKTRGYENQSREAGMIAFLQKPFNFTVLVPLLNDIISETH